ncbi:hypothetical protein UFOVP1382_145 [uncultured Caudovirales phage]|uniref:Uncharacterized protein n=1 Tax=uncultured Caudovirales phage TaxID=2100421 RepID=A0A6J5S4I2_9CAUD|nr:hypothetical protein UFOVP1382_145 [uncultured Caudovirales phage]
MPQTTRMGIPYPKADEDPWYDNFVAAMAAIDGSFFASFEDRNLFVTHGGTVAWDATTSSLSVGSTLYVTVPSTGQRQSLAAATWSLADGEMLVVYISRGATEASALMAAVMPSVDPADAALVLAIRAGNKVYFRNGRVLETGDSAQVFEGETGGGGGAVVDRVDYFTGDGATVAFVLAHLPAADCLPFIFVQGLLYEATADYTIVGTTVTFAVAPILGQRVQIRYWT